MFSLADQPKSPPTWAGQGVSMGQPPPRPLPSDGKLNLQVHCSTLLGTNSSSEQTSYYPSMDSYPSQSPLQDRNQSVPVVHKRWTYTRWPWAEEEHQEEDPERPAARGNYEFERMTRMSNTPRTNAHTHHQPMSSVMCLCQLPNQHRYIL